MQLPFLRPHRRSLHTHVPPQACRSPTLPFPDRRACQAGSTAPMPLLALLRPTGIRCLCLNDIATCELHNRYAGVDARKIYCGVTFSFRFCSPKCLYPLPWSLTPSWPLLKISRHLYISDLNSASNICVTAQIFDSSNYRVLSSQLSIPHPQTNPLNFILFVGIFTL